MQSDVGLILSDADQNCLYQQVVQETREVLQSADSSTVIEHCLVGALDRLYDDLRPHFQSKEEGKSIELVQMQNLSKCLNLPSCLFFGLLTPLQQ